MKGKPEQTAGHGMKVVESRGRERLGKTCGRPWNVLVGGGGGGDSLAICQNGVRGKKKKDDKIYIPTLFVYSIKFSHL